MSSRNRMSDEAAAALAMAAGAFMVAFSGCASPWRFGGAFPAIITDPLIAGERGGSS
jgi:hypothetical protein